MDPDPLFPNVDPRIRIRIHVKMRWIRNAGKKVVGIQNEHYNRFAAHKFNVHKQLETLFVYILYVYSLRIKLSGLLT